MSKLAASRLVQSNSQVPSASSLTRDLIRLGKNCTEKAAIGTFILENGPELPISVEVQYLRSLVEAGYSDRALKIWHAKMPESHQKRKHWSHLGIILYCSCFRAASAEALLAKEEIETDSGICLAFIRAYSELKNTFGLEKWISKLEAAKASALTMNKAIEYIATSGMWPQVQKLIQLMSKKGQRVENDMVSLCFTSSTIEIPFSSVAALLSEDGGLLNVRKFREFLARDPATKLRTLLEEGKFSQASDFVLNQSLGRDIALAYQLLKHFSSLSNSVQQAEFRHLMPLFDKFSNHPNKNSQFVQFMLKFYLVRGDYDSFWSFANKFGLLTANPSIAGNLTKSNYTILWKVLWSRVRSHPAPVDLRQFVVTTVSNVALTGGLLKHALLSLSAIPDLPAITCLLEFIHVVYGLTISDEFIDVLTSINKIEGQYPSSHVVKSKIEHNRGRASGSWIKQAKKICSAHKADFELIRDQAGTLREDLCFP